MTNTNTYPYNSFNITATPEKLTMVPVFDDTLELIKVEDFHDIVHMLSENVGLDHYYENDDGYTYLSYNGGQYYYSTSQWAMSVEFENDMVNALLNHKTIEYYSVPDEDLEAILDQLDL